MAVKCKICATELAALAGGRCRKCRQLVCADCIASGSTKSPEGLLCRECARAGVDDPPPPAGERAGRSAAKRTVPIWKWTVFSLLLILAFVFIAYYPAFVAKRLGRELAAGGSGARTAATELVAIGSPRALRELERVAKDPGRPAERMIAIDALGEFPAQRAVAVLRELAAEAGLPEETALAVKQALARQQTFELRP